MLTTLVGSNCPLGGVGVCVYSDLTIFKPYFLTYYFKLRELDTDYLCELPKLNPLKKTPLFSVHVFWSSHHPNFPTFHCYSQGCAIPNTRVTRNNLLCQL